MLQVHLLLLNTFTARLNAGYGTLRILMVDLAGTAPASATLSRQLSAGRSPHTIMLLLRADESPRWNLFPVFPECQRPVGRCSSRSMVWPNCKARPGPVACRVTRNHLDAVFVLASHYAFRHDPSYSATGWGWFLVHPVAF